MYEAISSNKVRTVILIFIFIVFISALGYVFGKVTGFGYFGLPLALIISLTMGLSSYRYGDKIILSMSKARPVEKQEYPYLYNVVESMAIAAGLPTPKAYVIDDPAPNAFATGRDPEHASIAVTTGLLDKMNRQELEGVIAHEMSHVKGYDIRLMAVVSILAGIVVLLSDWLIRSFFWGGFRDRDEDMGQLGIVFALLGLVLAILSPIFAMLIQMAVSRKREFLADAQAAMLTRYPPGLASALKKLSADKEQLKVANKATAHLYIANPLKGSKLNRLFDTHPPIEDRIAKLEAM
ncbi:MAG: zinc metalloprotease HtpX [Actinobacteria bacterium]|nr:MAG: zinc metalloprotease HtpX [Actinomycetota bacterium]